jgi:glycine/D-amino acid oxidase-like deaminating enzyme
VSRRASLFGTSDGAAFLRQTYDAIVLGMGAMGAAATYQLAKRGARVLGIDQYDPPHRQGSSHGETRITQIACGEGEEYAPFARRSHEIWQDIERELGTGPGALLTQNGFILISGPKGARGHGISGFLQRTFEIAANVGIRAERLSAPDIRSRFPAFAVPDDEIAYHDKVSGFVRPEIKAKNGKWVRRQSPLTSGLRDRAARSARRLPVLPATQVWQSSPRCAEAREFFGR